MLKDEQINEDDVEGDISESPLLSVIQRDLGKIEKRVDNQLIVALLIITPLIYLYGHSEFKSKWLDLVSFLVIVAVIGITIFRILREKRGVAETYGLVCPVCGYVPRSHMFLSAATTERCSKCKAYLKVGQPR